MQFQPTEMGAANSWTTMMCIISRVQHTDEEYKQGDNTTFE